MASSQEEFPQYPVLAMCVIIPLQCVLSIFKASINAVSGVDLPPSISLKAISKIFCVPLSNITLTFCDTKVVHAKLITKYLHYFFILFKMFGYFRTLFYLCVTKADSYEKRNNIQRENNNRRH